MPVGNALYCARVFGCGDVAAMFSLTAKDILIGARNVRISAMDSLFNSSSNICSFGQENVYLSHMAVTDTHIAVCNTGLGNVTVYNACGDEMFPIGAGQLERPWGVFILNEGYVLVTDQRTGRLYKYRLEADAQPTWVCDNLTWPTGICVDAGGNI